MDRADWLKERRHLTEERYDRLFAPIYDQEWGASISPSHRRSLEKFLDLCPPGCLILDAACGTGKYWQLILASGRSVFGVDQSRAMLARARDKFPAVPTEKMELRELNYQAAFGAALCMDAMEFVFPEDWLPVLQNLHRAIQPGGCLYFTVEVASEAELKTSFQAAQKLGMPVVFGEAPLGDGYHYYPSIEQVREWAAAARFSLVEEAEGDEYYHLIVKA